MQKMHGFNPRRCNSDSTLSCIKKELLKVTIARLANTDVVEMFEKTLTRRFSCESTRFGFDTEILLPNHSKEDFNKMNIHESFKAFKRQDLNTGCKLKLDCDNSYSDRRFISKNSKT